ncbi:hypothetical protein AWW66_06945 [Micromonospora rosaria]|uniref:Uncharacterized protein n=1 Tax=Micromonospora rosaria TaxID=47874 RepID=A0A136PWE1_9ACTN|nr:hypothetical protein AWW66_06945 [Micromonospora rosaria]
MLPEDHVLFRITQLLLLMRVVAGPDTQGLGLERLGYYDFFSANPFLVIGRDEKKARAQLHLAGFDERQLSYAATGHRFVNRRRRLQHDLALLAAYDLATLRAGGWTLTARGLDTAHQFTALYAEQYMTSVRLVVQRLARFGSDAALARQAGQWLREPQLILDLYGATDAEDQEDRSEATHVQGGTADRVNEETPDV